MKRWTPDEVESLRRLKGDGLSPREIAVLLGRSRTAIYDRLSGKYEPERIARRNEEYRLAFPKRDDDCPLSARPTREMIMERDIRLSMPARDISAAMFGDPPVGYSALERRS